MAKNMQADFVQSRQAYFVRCCLNYKNCDVLSGYGEQNLIKVESDNLGANKISDWYIPYDEYDVYIRGELTSLPQESIWESEKSQEMLRKQKKENTILKNHYAQITNNQELDFSYDTAENSSEQPLAASASLNSLNNYVKDVIYLWMNTPIESDTYKIILKIVGQKYSIGPMSVNGAIHLIIHLTLYCPMSHLRISAPFYLQNYHSCRLEPQ